MAAVISECGKYRYWLERYPTGADPIDLSFDRERCSAMVFLMANPSTADAEKDDPTIRKCVGFAKRHGHQLLVVVNVLAGRSTDPKGLLTMGDPVGPENYKYLRQATELPHESLMVCAWGNAIDKRLRNHISKALDVLGAGESWSLGRELYCFGKTADGSPRHPLMLSYSTPLEIYTP